MKPYDTNRVKIAFDFLKANDYVRNQQHFADKIGFSKSNVSLVLNGKIPVSNELFNSILSAFPEINRDWLLTGEGEMLQTPPPPTTATAPEWVVKLLKEKDDTIGNLREEIGRLRERLEQLQRETNTH